MTELAYGHGLAAQRPEVRLHDAHLLPDIDYAESLLILADHAVRHDRALDSLLFALCWARFDLTVAGYAARETLMLHMDRCDVRYAVERVLAGLLDDKAQVDDLTERIVRGTLQFPRKFYEAA